MSYTISYFEEIVLLGFRGWAAEADFLVKDLPTNSKSRRVMQVKKIKELAGESIGRLLPEVKRAPKGCNLRKENSKTWIDSIEVEGRILPVHEAILIHTLFNKDVPKRSSGSKTNKVNSAIRDSYFDSDSNQVEVSTRVVERLVEVLNSRDDSKEDIIRAVEIFEQHFNSSDFADKEKKMSAIRNFSNSILRNIEPEG